MFVQPSDLMFKDERRPRTAPNTLSTTENHGKGETPEPTAADD